MRNKQFLIVQSLFAAVLFSVSATDGYARSSYGNTVDSHCLSFNGTTPYADYVPPDGDKCTFCHVPSPGSKATRVDPQWTWWQNQLSGGLDNFCPPQTNQAPDGTITAPANNSTFDVGSSVTFTGTGTDPDNNTPLAYSWNFGGAAANSTLQNPTVTLNAVGNFTVTLTVTDSLGRADPSPSAIAINVVDPNANQPPNGTIDTPSGNVAVNVGDSVTFSGSGSDPDNNLPLSYLWTFGGAAPDSILQSPSVTFTTPGTYTVKFTVKDSLGLADPTPATRTVSVGTGGVACTDQDGDMFSPDGGVCGPIDCDDFNASVNPSMVEACGDGVDNDCNGFVDSGDPHCNGGECLAELLRQVDITRAAWDAGEHELKVRGTWTAVGVNVDIYDAIIGDRIGSTVT
ncbi:MAG: PKD domain-containing protein, partial [Gammaproteobacteria bacterium]